MTYKETLLFIGKALTINHIEKNFKIVENQLRTNTIDWDAIVKVSTAHYVFPALYCNLKRANLLHFVPEDLVNYMAHITQLNRERNEQIIAQAKEINDLLLTNKVTPIFLKGTGNLLEGLYHDIAERMVGDIDFILAKTDYKKGIEILKDKGYKTDGKFVKDFHWHYPELVHPNKIAKIEVHNKILRDNVQYKLELKLLKNCTLTDKFYTLSDTNKFFATVLPKIFNDNLYYRKIISLRNAYDVFLISHLNSIDISSIEKDSKTYQKLSDYVNCMQYILENSIAITTISNEQTQSYLLSFKKMIAQNSVEQIKIKLASNFAINKQRLKVFFLAFKDMGYRKFVLKRIFELDFYRYVLGLK